MPKIKLFPSGPVPDKTTGIESTTHPFSNIYGLDPEKNSTIYMALDYIKGIQAYTNYGCTFDWSKIPSNATINSVTMKLKAKRTAGNYLEVPFSWGFLSVPTRSIDPNQMGSPYQNDANKVNIPDQLQLLSFTYSGMTLAELKNMWFHFFGARGWSHGNKQLTFECYGISMEVDYSIPTPYFVKEQNIWKPISIYKKVNNNWILQDSSSSNIFDPKIKYYHKSP